MPQLSVHLATEKQCDEQTIALQAGRVAKHAVALPMGPSRIAVTASADEAPTPLKLNGKRLGNDLLLEVEDNGAAAEITLTDYFAACVDGGCPELVVDGTSYVYASGALVDDGPGSEAPSCLAPLAPLDVPLAAWLLGLGAAAVAVVAMKGGSDGGADSIDATDGRKTINGSVGGDLIKIIGNENVDVLDGSEGYDTVQVSGALDLMALPAGAVINIERIDLGAATGGQLLQLAPEDLRDAVGSGGTLTVDGGVGDSVTLAEGPWTSAGEITEGGQTYAIWRSGGGETVRVDTDVTLKFDTVAAAAAVVNAVAGEGQINAADKSAVVISGSAEPKSSVELTLDDGTARDAVMQADGQWSYAVTEADIAAMGEGPESIEITVTDLAGNVSVPTVHPVSVDTVAPSALAVVPLVNDGNSIGASVAGVGTAVLVSLTGTGAAAGDTVQVKWGTAVVDVVVTADQLAAGSVSVPIGSELIAQQAEGVAPVTVQLIDAAGNAGPESAPVDVMIDRLAPAAPAVPAVAAGDAQTVNAAEAADGTLVSVNLAATGAQAGDTLRLNWGEQPVDRVLTDADIAAGLVDVAVSVAVMNSQGDGAVAVTTQLIDGSGNVGSASAPISLVVDREAPSSPPAAMLVDDADNGINAAQAADDAVVQINLVGTGAAVGDTLRLHWGDQVIEQVLTSDTVASVVVSAAVIRAQGDGTFNVSSEIVDQAGNIGPSGVAKSVTVDMTAPAPATSATLSALDDTGLANNDSITSQTVLTVSGTGEAGSTAAVFDDVNNNGVIDTGESSASVLVGADGTFSVDVAVGEGVRHVRSILTDAFGNAGAASATTTVTVDATAPLAPATLVVAENADGGINGTEAADGVLVEVPLAGAMGAAGDLVRLTWMGSQTVDHVITATEAALGTASVLVSAALVDLQGGDGDASVAAQLIDVAGNAGPMSAVTTVSINRSPPADQIDWQGLAAADDSGVSDADGITNHASALTFGGVTVLPADTLAGVAAKIFNDVNDNGAVDPGEAVLAVAPLVPTQPMWNSFSVDLDLAEGFYNLRAVVVDSTGNEGQMSAARPITIDTTAPAASRIDRVTDDNLVDFPEQAVGITAKGTAEADSSVHLQFSSGLSKIFAADVGGVWSCFLTPAELLNMGDASGSESLTVTLTDRAGNVSEAALRQFTMF